MHGEGDFGGGGQKDFDEVDGAVADGGHAIEDEAAGGGVDQVDNVVELAAELVDVFAVQRSDEGLVELGKDVVSDLVALVLDGFDILDLLGHGGVVRKHLEEGFGAGVDVLGLLDEEIEKPFFTRQKPLQ